MSHNSSRPLSGLFAAPGALERSKPVGPSAPPRLWAMEALEGRVLLSATVYKVNAITDAGAGSGTAGDLMYVINQANADPNPDGSLIQFDPTLFAAPQTITLSATLTLSETAGPEVISGPGAGLVTVSGDNAVRVFSVSGGVTATLSGLTIANGSDRSHRPRWRRDLQ